MASGADFRSLTHSSISHSLNNSLILRNQRFISGKTSQHSTMFGRRRVVVLDKPVHLRDQSERQRKADQDDEVFLDTEINDRRQVCARLQEWRLCSWQVRKLYSKVVSTAPLSGRSAAADRLAMTNPNPRARGHGHTRKSMVPLPPPRRGYFGISTGPADLPADSPADSPCSL